LCLVVTYKTIIFSILFDYVDRDKIKYKKIKSVRLTLLTRDLNVVSSQLLSWVLNYDNNYLYLYVDLDQLVLILPTRDLGLALVNYNNKYCL
jgi:hypothetical protein